MMNTTLFFTIYLISDLVHCFDVIGYSESSVQIYCRHPHYGELNKYFCKIKKCNDTQLQKPWVHTQRLSLLDYARVLRVLYRNLRLHDTGSYLCGETGVWNHTVNLKVKTDPCCSGPSAVTVFLGETLTINCSYPDEFKTQTKGLYKQAGKYFTEVVRASWSLTDRFSISEDRRSKVVSVRISDVREEDGGVYFCGVWIGGDSVSYNSLFKPIQLQVTEKGKAATSIAPAKTSTSLKPTAETYRITSTTTTTTTTATATTMTMTPPVKDHLTYNVNIIASVCVCVTLLLIVGGTVYFHKLKSKKPQGFAFTWKGSGTNNICDADKENDPPGIYIMMDPIYQNINSIFSESDSVYENVDPKTNQSY